MKYECQHSFNSKRRNAWMKQACVEFSFVNPEILNYIGSLSLVSVVKTKVGRETVI